MKNQLKKINFNHSFIFFLFCNIFSLIILKFENLVFSPLFCLLLILSIGVSHGSLDHIKGKKLLNSTLEKKNTQIHLIEASAVSQVLTLVIWDGISCPRAFSTLTWSGEYRVPSGMGIPSNWGVSATFSFTSTGIVYAVLWAWP